MVIHSLFRLNDQFFVQELGVEAQSAVAVCGMLVIFFMGFSQMVATGTLAIAARRLGEKRHDPAHEVMRAGLRSAVAVGAVLAAVSIALLPWLCEILIQGEDVAHERDLAYRYMVWICGGQIVLAVLPTIDSSFFALRDTRTPMLLQLLAIVTNALLNWLLIPVYGIAGAGIATILSRIGSLVLGLWLLGRAGAVLWHGGVARRIVGRIFAIGYPACIAIGVYALVYKVILAWTFPHFGAAGRSALGVGFGIESMFYCFFWGIGTAVASLVGNALGEGAPERAEAIARTAAKLSLAVGLATSAIFWTAGPVMVRWFADSDIAIAASVDYLELMAWAQPFQALQVIYEQALIGAGATLPTMIAAVSMNTLRIPLAQLFAVGLGWGLAGIWWAINLSSFGKCVWAWALFRAGRWKQRRV